MYAAGFYTYSIFALIFWETRRSDFGVSMGHHVATVILIVLSYIFRYVVVESCLQLGNVLFVTTLLGSSAGFTHRKIVSEIITMLPMLYNSCSEDL